MKNETNAIDFWLTGDRLPTDLVMHLGTANSRSDPRVHEVVGLLQDLLGLIATADYAQGLTRAEARAAIRSAMDFVLERWARDRVRDGKLEADDAVSVDISMIPTREFMRGFVQALARQVRWKRNDVKTSRPAPANPGKA